MNQRITTVQEIINRLSPGYVTLGEDPIVSMSNLLQDIGILAKSGDVSLGQCLEWVITGYLSSKPEDLLQ